MLSRAGWTLSTLAVAGLATLAPTAPELVADLHDSDFAGTMLAIGSLAQLGFSAWVLGVVALALVRAPAPLLRAVAPHLVRRAMFAGTAGALALSPASADRAAAPTESNGHDIVGLRLPDRPTAAPRPARVTAPVVVRAGDTLWAIAADTLPEDADPARVARECARWYDSNRAVIGADPDLIFPAQKLIPPAGKDPT